MSSTVPPYDTLLSIFGFLNGDLSTLTAARLVCKLFDDAASTVIYETVVDDPFSSIVRPGPIIILLDSNLA